MKGLKQLERRITKASSCFQWMAYVWFYSPGPLWIFRKGKVRSNWVFPFVLLVISFSRRGSHTPGRHFEMKTKITLACQTICNEPHMTFLEYSKFPIIMLGKLILNWLNLGKLDVIIIRTICFLMLAIVEICQLTEPKSVLAHYKDSRTVVGRGLWSMTVFTQKCNIK